MSRRIDARKSLRSFRFAFEGVRRLFQFENNAKIHALAALAVVIVGWWVQLDRVEWALIVLQIGLVWAAEAFNTAIEKLADVVSPAFHPQIKSVKDLSAGGVLIVTTVAIVVGLLIFGNKFMDQL